MTSKRALFFTRVFIFIVFLPATHLLGQNKVVTGVVTSGTNNTVSAGVSVLVKGTANGVLTNSQGRYSITIPGSSSFLVFSSAEFETQQIKVGNKSEINVALVQRSGILSDVVLVGYGTQRKKEVTSAITTISADQFNKGNITDVAQLLQGKVAGLSIARPGADPNQSFEIRLRGLSSVGQNTTPLIVVDGAAGVDLNSIDPSDIASVDVIKDGAGAAIYGTRGSAGVILITTKRGQSGKTLVDYNGYVSAEQVAHTLPVATASQYRGIMQKIGAGTDYGTSTDWIKAITRTAITQVHNVSLSGGGPNSSYRASVNYRNGEGVAINTGYQQLISTLNLNQKAFNNKLNLSFIMTQTTRNADLGFDQAFREAYTANPTAAIYDDTSALSSRYGGYNHNWFPEGSQKANPVQLLKETVNHSELKRLNSNFQAELEVLKGLKIMGHYAMQRDNNYQTIFVNSTTDFDNRPYWSFGSNLGVGNGGFGRKYDYEYSTQLLESTGTYAFQPVNKLDATLLAGYSYQTFDNESFDAANGIFLSDALQANNLGAGLGLGRGDAIIESDKSNSKLIAFFGRLNLNYNNLFFLMASIRREGSTKFGVNHKWGDFPAVSAGLDIAKLIDVPIVNNLKFRTSYGITGSLPNDPYLSLSTFTSGSPFYYNGAYVSSYGPSRNANPDLKWERKAETDLGVDFGLFKGRLNGTIDYYNSKTTDLLWYATVPVPPNFATNTWKNFGTLKSNGFEVALNYNVLITKDIKWTSGFNISTNTVRLISLADYKNNDTLFHLADLGAPSLNQNPQSEPIALWPGGKIGVIWGQTFKGVGSNGQWVVDSASKGPNGKSTLSQIGNALPKFELGFTNSFSYKHWDLYFTLRGAFGYDLVNSWRAHYEIPQAVQGANVVMTKYYLPALSKTAPPFFSSYDVENASYLKMDNATLGYTIPLPSNSSFRIIRVYFATNNLFVITKYTGVDPEIHYNDNENSRLNSIDYSDVEQGSILAPGIERRGSWARTRTFTLGVNVGF